MSAVFTELPPAAGPSRGTQRRRRPRNRDRDSNNPDAVSVPAHPHPHATDESALQAPAQTSQSQRGGRNGRGRGRGRGQGQSRGGGEAGRQAGALRDAPGGAGEATGTPDAQPFIPTQSGQRGGRGGAGKGRGRGGPNLAAIGRVGPGGRHFGGQLTVDLSSPTASINGDANAYLRADAPTFQPGPSSSQSKSQATASASRRKQPMEQRPKAPKSAASDIATRTHEDIDNGHYECAVCYQELKRRSRVWSCRTCWTVFHLGCIKEWSSKEGSAVARPQLEDGECAPRQWRCPGCNLPKDILPKHFSCWCEKEIDPKSLSGLPPFSCGQTCARSRILPKKCPHPCPNICHAGPCPPCSQMGPTQFCYCGKKSLTRRCIDTNYEEGWSCGDVCGELMPCGVHTCSRPCHEGLCGACEVRVPARCYCGHVSKDILCCDRGDEVESSRSHIAADGSVAVEHWTGLFECTNTCKRQFDCGKHSCEKSCHTQDAEPPHCPRSPDVVLNCPCGKTPLREMSDTIRQSCEDPIPNCSKPCAKQLSCGHSCQQLCHQGECLPCLRIVSIACRCGRTVSSTVCHQGLDEPPQCMRVCRVSLNCGRHECGEHCCPGERKAAERQATRRKPRPLDAPRQLGDNIEAEHICTRSCGRPLKCGNPDHRCQELCHKGTCGTCREAIFDEISCNCGRTVLQPPLPCGTKPPLCRYPCERPKDCGHPQVNHNCHQDDEGCPKCPFLTIKPCLCGKHSLKNQPCWLAEVRCGEVCGRTLKCGAHSCQKQCHRPGDCEQPCSQICGKELTICRHPCMAPCHSPNMCQEGKPCQHKIFVTCECQRIKQEMKCNASKNGPGNLNNSLKCDAECARLERNRKLALALNVDLETRQNDHVPYSADTLNMYQSNSTWAVAQEKILRLFAADSAEKRLRFRPMTAQQRAFIHSLAEDFGFDHESMDPEPHRHVFIFKTPRFVMAPMKTLAECTRIRHSQRPVPVPTVISTTSSRPKPSVADPFNSFLITNPRFGLTIEEVNSAVRSAIAKTPFPLELEVHFLPSEDVALRPPLMSRVNMPDGEMQTRLETIKPAVVQAITSQRIGKVQLARLDASLNVLRREADLSSAGGGWSDVARKGVPTRKIERNTPFGNRGGFAVLSLSSTRKKKEKATEVVDDWEAAEMMEEEKERVSGASAVNSEDEGRASLGKPEIDDEQARRSEELLFTPIEGRWADLDDD